MDFPSGYQLVGNTVTPPAARDLVGLVVESLTGQYLSAATQSGNPPAGYA